MQLLVEVSAGELVDKLTILEIKLENIADPAKRANIAREYAALCQVFEKEIVASDALRRLRDALKEINRALWRIEDDIRAQERAGTFGQEFVALARSVYHTNDRRAALKREINLLLRSNFVEEKSYADY